MSIVHAENPEVVSEGITVREGSTGAMYEFSEEEGVLKLQADKEYVFQNVAKGGFVQLKNGQIIQADLVAAEEATWEFPGVYPITVPRGARVMFKEGKATISPFIGEQASSFEYAMEGQPIVVSNPIYDVSVKGNFLSGNDFVVRKPVGIPLPKNYFRVIGADDVAGILEVTPETLRLHEGTMHINAAIEVTPYDAVDIHLESEHGSWTMQDMQQKNGNIIDINEKTGQIILKRDGEKPGFGLRFVNENKFVNIGPNDRLALYPKRGVTVLTNRDDQNKIPLVEVIPEGNIDEKSMLLEVMNGHTGVYVKKSKLLILPNIPSFDLEAGDLIVKESTPLEVGIGNHRLIMDNYDNVVTVRGLDQLPLVQVNSDIKRFQGLTKKEIEEKLKDKIKTERNMLVGEFGDQELKLIGKAAEQLPPTILEGITTLEMRNLPPNVLGQNFIETHQIELDPIILLDQKVGIGTIAHEATHTIVARKELEDEALVKAGKKRYEDTLVAQLNAIRGDVPSTVRHPGGAQQWAGKKDDLPSGGFARAYGTRVYEDDTKKMERKNKLQADINKLRQERNLDNLQKNNLQDSEKELASINEYFRYTSIYREELTSIIDVYYKTPELLSKHAVKDERLKKKIIILRDMGLLPQDFMAQ